MRRLTGSDAGGLTAPSSSDISLFTDVFALLSAVLGVVFATMGQRHHRHLVYGITMTAGVFGGLLFCNLVFPPSITDAAKIVCSLVIGFGLWYLALHEEKVVLQIFGMSAGMATGTLVFNIVAEFYIINAHFLILALAAGCAIGFVLAGYMENGAFVMMYASTGGFLVMSAASYAMWKTGRSARGDLWLTHITHSEHGLDVGAQSNVTCLVLWGACTVMGVVVQNSCCRPVESDVERSALLKRDYSSTA